MMRRMTMARTNKAVIERLALDLLLLAGRQGG